MRRREFIALFGGTAIAWPLAASAQTPKTGYPSKPVRIIVPVAAAAASSPEELGKLLRSEIARWSALIKSVGIKLD